MIDNKVDNWIVAYYSNGSSSFIYVKTHIERDRERESERRESKINIVCVCVFNRVPHRQFMQILFSFFEYASYRYIDWTRPNTHLHIYVPKCSFHSIIIRRSQANEFAQYFFSFLPPKIADFAVVIALFLSVGSHADGKQKQSH